MTRFRRTAALAATALALSGGSLGIGATEAQAASASCGVITIGQPGDITAHGTYAGQVEQLYDSCDGNVWAHWQWSTLFRSAYPAATINVGILSPNQFVTWSGYEGTTYQDVYSPAAAIHSANPDDWEAVAVISSDSCAGEAVGTLHWYGGADWAGPNSYTC